MLTLEVVVVQLVAVVAFDDALSSACAILGSDVGVGARDILQAVDVCLRGLVGSGGNERRGLCHQRVKPMYAALLT